MIFLLLFLKGSSLPSFTVILQAHFSPVNMVCIKKYPKFDVAGRFPPA